MPTILIDWVFCLNAKFNSVNCPAVICSPNTCYLRVTTSYDRREPRSFIFIIIAPLSNALKVVPTIFWRRCLCVTATAAVLLLLLLSYYCCFHITPVTSAFLGAAELTTPLLRLISILCLPLCRINKFGFYFPRRLLRSPILVGHHPTRLAKVSPATAPENSLDDPQV